VHDRLIEPITASNRRWLADHQPQLAQLETRAKEWVHGERGSAALLDQVEVLEAESWRSSEGEAGFGYSELVQAFVEASKSALEHRRLRKLLFLMRVTLALTVAILGGIILLLLQS